jgi:hypothetical protein
VTLFRSLIAVRATYIGVKRTSRRDERQLDGIERAIRNALAKGDASDRAYREKVYRSAFSALERTLAGNAEVSDEMRTSRRQALKATVTRIETEYVPARAADAPQPELRPEPRIDMRGEVPAAPSAGRAEPVFGAEPAQGRTQTPTPANAGLAAERDEARVRLASRRNWSGLILPILAVALVAGGVWWVWQAGLLSLPATQQPIVDTGREVATEEPARPTTIQVADDDDWTRIFTPDDPATVTATGDTTASVASAEGEDFLLAHTGESGTPVRFSIGEGILQRVAGGRAVFRISAAADEEAGETQISVECDLAALGDCGRRRYLVGITREDFLFEVQLPSTRPGGEGRISINTDLEGQGRPVRIYSISVAPAR